MAARRARSIRRPRQVRRHACAAPLLCLGSIQEPWPRAPTAPGRPVLCTCQTTLRPPRAHRAPTHNPVPRGHPPTLHRIRRGRRAAPHRRRHHCGRQVRLRVRATRGRTHGQISRTLPRRIPSAAARTPGMPHGPYENPRWVRARRVAQRAPTDLPTQRHLPIADSPQDSDPTIPTMNRTPTTELSPHSLGPLHAIRTVNSTSSPTPAQRCHRHHPTNPGPLPGPTILLSYPQTRLTTPFSTGTPLTSRWSISKPNHHSEFKRGGGRREKVAGKPSGSLGAHLGAACIQYCSQRERKCAAAVKYCSVESVLPKVL